MGDRKTFKVSKEDYMMLSRIKSISKESKQYERLRTIKQYEMRIEGMKREILYKKGQISSGESNEKVEVYLDGKKPLWYLQNDVDQLEFEIVGLKDAIVKIKKEYEADLEGEND